MRPGWAFATTTALLLIALPAAPAGATAGSSAARDGACASGTADTVTVAVDFGSLGGGLLVRCASGLTAASRGTDALAAAGISWTPVTNQPGFACRISGRPAADETFARPADQNYRESCVNTPPADAYWSYWKSGGDGSWEYSSTGPTSGRVRLGGFEGWVFSAGGQNPPRVSPVPAPCTCSPAPCT